MMTLNRGLEKKMTDDELKVALLQKKALTALKIFEDEMMPTDNDIAEEFFFQSLIKDNHLGSVHFDDVIKSMQKHRGQIQEEYDLVMTNGDAVGIVEVKYKAHENDLDKLDRKMRHFKKLFPIYQNYKQYGAIASFYINDDAKKEALKRGYFVLQRSGDLVHTESSEHLTVL